MRKTSVFKEILLVGGGHSHVQVMKAFAMRPVAGVRLTLVARDDETPYSGMLPGLVAGHYEHDECHVDLRRLAAATGVRLVKNEVVGLDKGGRRVLLRDRPPLRYDLVSINVGASTALRVPGAAGRVTPVKPVDAFLATWASIIRRTQGTGRPLRIVVIGGGAGGVELTLAMAHRLQGLAPRPDGVATQLALVTDADLLANRSRRARALVAREFERRRIAIHRRAQVVEVGDKALFCADGRAIPFDEAIAATGADAPAWIAASGLATDEKGFAAVDGNLRVLGETGVFAAGDVASMPSDRREKSGVIAVRQGPVLADNLRRAVLDRPLRTFAPQRRFLFLIGSGGQDAIASWGRFAVRGRSLWRLKQWIDRRWMARFKIARATGMAAGGDALAEAAATGDAMRCGGCGAKVPAQVLRRVLDRLGIAAEAADDAVLLPSAGAEMLQTADFFRAMLDDPYVFGQIATVHALGDIHAKGGTPLYALATAGIPHGAPAIMEEDLFQMLSGADAVLRAAGARLVGGHSAELDDLALGFAVTGKVGARTLRKGGLSPGDRLILTKPLGTGAIFAAAMRGEAGAAWIDQAIASMLISSATAAQVLLDYRASACTDVTGFGLAGHLAEMLVASGMAADLDLEAVPSLPGALQLRAAGHASTLQSGNEAAQAGVVALTGDAREWLLFDPQTAGGLLAGVPEAQTAECLSALRRGGYPKAAVIGVVRPPEPDDTRIRLFGRAVGADTRPGRSASASAEAQ